MKARKIISSVFLLVFGFATAFGLAEGMLRTFFANQFMIAENHMTLKYRWDSQLGWAPKENSSYEFSAGSKSITVSHNSRGFRDKEHVKGEKESVVILGDSFVWGYDVDVNERFTEKLRLLMPEWDVYNLGVSGYGTDQEFLLLLKNFDFYRPKIVFLIYCSDNDDSNNSSNSIDSGRFYKPYFDVLNHAKMVNGVPVPKSLNYYGQQYPRLTRSYVVRLIVKALSPPPIKVASPTMEIFRQMNRFVSERGCKLLVALTSSSPGMESFFRDEGIPHLQLDGAEKFPSHGRHWTPDGHSEVSKRIYNFIQTKG